MAAVAPTSDQAAELLQKMTLESQTKTLDVPDPTKKASAIQYGSIDSGNLAKGIMKPFERSTTPLPQDFMDPNNCYLPNGYPSTTYYYGGYDGQEWEDYSRFVNPDGVEVPHDVYGENGSLMFHNGYGYAPYGAYPPPGSPVPTMGHDGQLYGQQQYQYPSYYPPPTPTNGPFPPNQVNASPVDVSAANQVSLSNGTAKGNPKGGSLNGNNGSKPVRPNYNGSSLSSNGSYGMGQHLTGFNHARPGSGLGQASGYMNRMYPNNRMYGQYGNTLRTGSGYGSMGYDSRTNGRGWLVVDNKYKTRGRSNGSFGYRNENVDGLSELNRGPRAQGRKDQKGFGSSTLAVNAQTLPSTENDKEDKVSQIPDKEQYNKEDFPEKYSVAKFFVIKSYSEDDVHRSIKYNVWASTHNGNKKLDLAYQESQQKPGGCPVFLLFSVNTSGQFVGLAEMVGPVDFNKSLEFWQQDKWNGCFPLKWHIVKDVPNSLLRHITLENNENKPVTNSRDTQEVKLEQGIELVKIFKGHSSKTCILDDFGFYETRQRTMQEKKVRQQQFQKQVWESAISSDDKGKDGPNGAQNIPKSFVVPKSSAPAVLVKANGEVKQCEENGSAPAALVKANGEVKQCEENGSAPAALVKANGEVKKLEENGSAAAQLH